MAYAGYYHLENVADDSGNGRNLTNENVIVFNAGKFNLCADSGVGNTNKRLIRTADNYGIVSADPLTIVAWVKAYTPTAAQHDIFWLCPEAAGLVYHVFYDNTQNVTFDRYRAGLGSTFFAVSQNLEDAFHCIIMTYDGTNLKGYVDGVFKNQVAASGAGGGAGYVVGFSLFANAQGTPGTLGDFKIDEVIIEERAWTNTEISNYYNSLLGRLSGKNGSVLIAGITTAGIKRWEVDYIIDTPDVTAFDSSGHRAYMVGEDGWKGKFLGYKDGVPLTIGMEVALELRETQTAGQRWTGQGIVTGVTDQVRIDGVVAYEYVFEGTGALTIPTA